MTLDQAVTRTITKPRRTNKQRFQIVAAVIMVAALVLGLYTRIAASPTSERAPAAPAPAAAVDTIVPPAAGATKITNGVPVGYPRSVKGATAAATNYLTTLYGSTAVLGKDSAKIISTVAVPGKEADLAAKLDPTLTEARAALGMDEDGTVQDGQTTAYRIAPLSHTATAYNDSQATITVWWVGIVGVASDSTTFPAMSVWGTDTVTLTWAAGDWKWANSKHAEGPAPVTGTDPTNSDALAKALREGTPYGYGR